MTLTGQLAEFVCGFGEIPDNVIAAAKTAMIDTIGVALAGSVEPAALAAFDYGREVGANPGATIWGHDIKSSPAEAAFANAVACHALDFDDTLATLRGHPSATVLPVVLALGEQSGQSGRLVLEAYVLGVEIAGKLGKIFGNGHYLRGWHSTATIGTFSATAAAARVHANSVRTLQRAWGIAAAQAGGLIRNFGTMSKPFQAGHAARSAIIAEAMARRSFTADENIFDGKDSFPRTYGADGLDGSKLLSRLGNPWELVSPGLNYKRWPCCYCSHRPLGGLLNLVAQHAIKATDVESVGVGFPPGADEPLIHDDPQTGLEGKFSAQYPIAAMLLDGTLTPDSFTDEAVRRPAVRAMMKKVRRYRVADDKVYSGTVGYTDIEVRTSRGTYSCRVDKGPGSPAWPMTEEEHEQKFRSCAERALDAAEAGKLLELLRRCDALSDIGQLARQLASGKPNMARATITRSESASRLAGETLLP